MRLSGVSPDGRLVEIAELEDHPFMLGTQFHPEFLSRPNRPHPLFIAFLKAVRGKAGLLRSTEIEAMPVGTPIEEYSGVGQNGEKG